MDIMNYALDWVGETPEITETSMTVDNRWSFNTAEEALRYQLKAIVFYMNEAKATIDFNYKRMANLKALALRLKDGSYKPQLVEPQESTANS
jgi:hypothetical protein